MSERITDARLSELIALAAQDPHTSEWHRDTDAALLELQDRRKADRDTPVTPVDLDGVVSCGACTYSFEDECFGVIFTRKDKFCPGCGKRLVWV